MLLAGFRGRKGRLLPVRAMAIFLPLLYLFAGLPAAAAPEDRAPADLLAGLEVLCLAAPPAASLVQRLTELELAVNGRAGHGTIPERINALVETVILNSTHTISLLFRMNAIEWELYRRVTNRPIQVRLAELEREVLGQTGTGAMADRLETLSAGLWAAGRPLTTPVDLTPGTLVKVKLLADLSSTANKPGDKFRYEVAESVIQDGLIVIPKGSTGEGYISLIEPPGNMGRDARITMVFGPVSTLDGTSVATTAGEESIAANKTARLTVRVTAAGMIVLGPAGILSGLFVRGKEVFLAAGTEFYIQTAAVTHCYTLARGVK